MYSQVCRFNLLHSSQSPDEEILVMYLSLSLAILSSLVIDPTLWERSLRAVSEKAQSQDTDLAHVFTYCGIFVP